jgi:hypothetical protein
MDGRVKSLLLLQRALAASRDTLLAAYNSSLLFKLLQQKGDKKRGAEKEKSLFYSHQVIYVSVLRSHTW